MKSLYVHIPFCYHICSYCDFCKVFYREDWADEYLDALAFEIKDKQLFENYDTIYIGGGTPSSLSFQQLQRLLKMLQPFSCQTQEYSIEVNPESMTNDKLDLFVQYHINRLSIGVQTFHDELLQNIQRHHTAQQAIDFIEQAKRKGITDINVDLMYGLPEQTLEDVKEDIQIIKELNISHLSVYSLILEEHTFLKKENYRPLDDEQDAIWYQYINQSLKQIGFTHYEVSNYQRYKPSYHNLVYWHYQDYDGIGLSAHSLCNHYRLENTNSLTQYLKHHYLKEKTFLTSKDELFEKIMMGLRLIDGIDTDEINKSFHIDFYNLFEDVVDKYEKMNMLKREDCFLKTTSLGMNYLNSILVDMLEKLEE